MATRRHNGHKHHSRRYQSNEQMNRRRLSKQEEIDLTVDGIDDKYNNLISSESSVNTSLAPLIHVNSVEDKLAQKAIIITERNRNESKGIKDSNDNCDQQLITASNLEKSFADKLNVNESNTEDNREKKRGKYLARAEAVRDTSASPPPTQISDVEDNSLHKLSTNSSNSQTQTGNSVINTNEGKAKSQGSSGSLDRSSPSLSRDSSTENYSDLNGTDVQQFLIETLQTNKKDRVFLLKIEQDLNSLVKDSQKSNFKFSPMTSYNRMLVHRVAALFGFEHNVDSNGTSVVVNKCKNTRIPDMKFKDHIKEDLLHEPKKSILKRDSASLEDGSSSSISFDGKEKSPDRQMGVICDATRSKSFEEREERYEKARARIFNQDSSSSNEGIDSNNHPTPEHNNSSFQRVSLQSSPVCAPKSQSNEDLTTKINSTEVKNWNSSNDSENSGLHKNEPKSITTGVQVKVANCLESEPKATPLSSSCGRVSLLAPNFSVNTNSTTTQSKNRPSVTKASSFGGISRNVDNGSNSTQTHLSKSGSFNVSQNSNYCQNGGNGVNRSNTPKNSCRQESAHKSVANNTTSDQRYVSSQQTSVHSSTASHHNRHNWHQNSHSRNNSNNSNNIINSNNSNREQSFNSVQWPQNYPHFMFPTQNDSNLNQIKENHYLQSGPQLYLSSVPTYGPTVSNEVPQHLTQTPIRLIYPNVNPNQPQLRPNVNPLMNGSVTHQNVSNQMNSVPFPMQSTSSVLNFSGNHPNIQNNAMISGALSHSYGTPLQMASNVGTVWIIGNGVNPQSSSPLMTCPPPANTPPSASIGSNIAPFVGMSYQQYRPTLNSNVTLNPNLSVNAAQNRGNNPLLKSQPLIATQTNNPRILTSNGNPYIQQQVPEVVDVNNLLGTNNYVNRGPIASQISHLRRMPANSNQGLDVRLVGPQSSPPFLLPTPQRPYYSMQNSVTVNHRSFYANNVNNSNQRSKHSFSKNKSQNNRYNTNNRNILVANNTNTNNTNT